MLSPRHFGKPVRAWISNPSSRFAVVRSSTGLVPMVGGSGFVSMIRLSGAQVAQMNARFTDYVNALADFVADGGAIEIRAEPEEPLALTALQNANGAPQTLPDVLNLTVTHKAP